LALGTALCCLVGLTISPPALGQGATTPFITYEAEEGTLAGGATVQRLAAPLLDNWSSPELEASGRAYVELKATGASVTMPNNTGAPVTFIDFRYSIPDSTTGGGITSTLNLYVDGVFRQSLYVSSKQIWLYSGTGSSWDGMNQDPSVPNPHIFFEEGHTFIAGPPVAPGSKISFQKDAANTAAFYWLDCVDLENPPAPIAQPANSISITDMGAVATSVNDPIPSGVTDSTSAIQKTIDAAASQGKSVWIPQGRFIVTGGLNATGVTIEGAGMWYSAVYRNPPLPVTNPLATFWNVTSVTMRNFLVDSNAESRTNADGDAGGITIGGSNWLVEDMWIQHCSSGVWAQGSNGTVRDCWVLSTWGDGVNLNNGNNGAMGNDLTAENNYVRGVGDDGVTINSDGSSAQMQNPTLKNNTTVSIYWADGLRVAGGQNIDVEGNLLCDPANFPGIIVGIFNGANLDSGVVKNNTIVRGGGDSYNENVAALQIGVGSPGSVSVNGVQITNNIIIDSMQKAIELTSSNSVTLANNIVDGLWVNAAASSSVVGAISVSSGVMGSATFSTNTLQDLMSGQTAFVNRSPGAYQTSGTGNTGFDPTTAGPTLWNGPSDAGAKRLTASCTTPLSMILSTGGVPEAGVDAQVGPVEAGAILDASAAGAATGGGGTAGESTGAADSSGAGGMSATGSASGSLAETGVSTGGTGSSASSGSAPGSNALASPANAGCGCNMFGAPADPLSRVMGSLWAVLMIYRRRGTAGNKRSAPR
jgi:alpha-1,3-glucanase-like protein/pectate lyase-like protein